MNTFDTRAFLRDSWQKRPCLIKGLWPAWSNPLDPDDLAGLACEAEVEARIITQVDAVYAVEHGPFAEERFATIGKDPWTLLVQAVDHYVPDVAALLAPFRFIPNWRIDDVMVSYAVDQGGVGPHFDQYDVFLVQGLGCRRWQVGGRCDERSALVENEEVRLLAQFEPEAEWILEPGDVLYVPPGIAHHGVALGDDCMTYSIGFRAPSRAELIVGWSEHLVRQMSDDDRYADPALPLQDNAGEITAEALAALQAMVSESMADPETFAQWFGQYSTLPKNLEIDWAPEERTTLSELRDAVPVCLARNPASRFSFVRQGGGAIALFVDGRSYGCTGQLATFAERLCASEQITTLDADAASETTLALIVDLLNRGSIEFCEDD
jgi:50S ribosomal protein L16 3-hydroxylase